MQINVKELGDKIAIVRLEGRLNMVTAARLREAISETVGNGNNRVSVDLAEVVFIDSSGLGALINGLKTARLAGGDLRISAPTEQVKLVLKLTNVERVLTVYDRAETAFANG